MTRVQVLFEDTAKRVFGARISYDYDIFGYKDPVTEDMWSLFSLAYCYGERDATKPLHELEEPNE